jgi:hypothetical protein
MCVYLCIAKKLITLMPNGFPDITKSQNNILTLFFCDPYTTLYARFKANYKKESVVAIIFESLANIESTNLIFFFGISEK